jgi:hypothetical protein
LKIEYHDGEVVELGFDDRLHSYRVGKDPETELIPSVTQTMDVISKPALIPWALKEGVEWLAGNLFFDRETKHKNIFHTKGMGIDFLTKGIKGAYRNTSTSAINIGSITHKWVEEAIRWKLEGGDPPLMPKQKEAQTAIEAFRAWVSENEVEWHSAERKLYHRTYKYAGTVDAVATINGEHCVIDWKTSKAVYPEYYLQVAAYAKAVEDMDGVEIDSAYILRCDKKTGKFECVRSENFELDFDAFLAAQRLRRRLKVLSKKRK